MIYDLPAKRSRPRLDDLKTQRSQSGIEHPTPGTFRRICTVLTMAAVIPLIPFITIYHLGKWILRIPDVIERAEAKYRRQQSEHGFDFENVVIEESYDARTGTLTFKMNYDALKGFATSLRELFTPQHYEPEMRTVGLRGSEHVHRMDPGWHAHSEFFFEPLPLELTVGIAEGLLLVHEGTGLYAPADLWAQITELWIEVADRRQEKLIVLDRYQRDWCDPQSTGRFVIEYIPDLVEASRRPRQSRDQH